MTNRIVLQRGRPPWLPHEYATDLDAWHYDDMPTLGTFKLGRMTVLFSADGELHPGRLHWWFADITGREPIIANVWTLEEMMHWVDEAFENSILRADGWTREYVLTEVWPR